MVRKQGFERPLYQSDVSYKETLQELQKRVFLSEPLNYYDCTDYGNKSTECSLGLCDDKIRASQDGIYQATGQICPHDGRYFEIDGSPKVPDPEYPKKEPGGCFYRCHIFKGTGRDMKSIKQRIHLVQP